MIGFLHTSRILSALCVGGIETACDSQRNCDSGAIDVTRTRRRFKSRMPEVYNAWSGRRLGGGGMGGSR